MFGSYLHDFQCLRLECVLVAPPAQLMRASVYQDVSCAVGGMVFRGGGRRGQLIVYDYIIGVISTVKVKALLESTSLLPCTLKVSFPCTRSQTLLCKAGRAWKWGWLTIVFLSCLVLVSHTSRFLLKWMLQLARLGPHFFQCNENTTIISIVTIYLSFVLLLDNTRHL